MIKTFSRVWEFSKERHKDLIKGLIFSFLRSLFSVTQFLAIIIVIQILFNDPAAPSIKSAIIEIIVLTLICIIGNFATSYFEQLSTLKTGFFMVADKRVSVGNILRQVPLGFFNSSSLERVTATLTTTLSGVETAAVMVMVGIISGLFNSLALFIFMLFYDWRFGLIAGLGMICYLLVVGYQMKVSRKNAPILQSAQTNLAEQALTYLHGIKVIKAFSFNKGSKKLNDAIDDSCEKNIFLTKVSMPSQYFSSITVAVFESIIFILSLVFCFVTQDLEPAKAIILMIFSFVVYAALNQAGSMLSMIGLLDSGLYDAEQIEKADKLKTIDPIEEPKSNEIVIEDLDFAYDDSKKVLDGISTKIKPNSLTAIIGPSGSGKTTLCHLIARFHDVTNGSIKLGGVDIRHINYDYLMSKISMVFQRVYLFEDTIMNNIRFAKPDATLEEVKIAAQKAHCDKFIEALPNGYETLVEEGGSNLSGGEKQRISIARAILKDSPIIILDEATSALDVENEREILGAIDELIRDKTVIMIAHRINTVKKADHIIAIDNGHIVEEGTHEELIHKDGLYKEFIDARVSSRGWKLTN